jgi:hypothetical protein
MTGRRSVMLSRDDILRGLARLDAMARASNIVVDLAIYGGAALALAFDLRVATRDVDAIVHGAPDFVRRSVAAIAQEEGWPADWLNDGVKGFISGKEDLKLMSDFSAAGGSGLRAFMPSPAYPFAMKCMAIRPEGIDGSHDISDIEALADIAKIRDSAEAIEIVEGFYPSNNIPPKVRFGIEEIMERVARKRPGKRKSVKVRKNLRRG